MRSCKWHMAYAHNSVMMSKCECMRWLDKATLSQLLEWLLCLESMRWIKKKKKSRNREQTNKPFQNAWEDHKIRKNSHHITPTNRSDVLTSKVEHTIFPMCYFPVHIWCDRLIFAHTHRMSVMIHMPFNLIDLRLGRVCAFAFAFAFVFPINFSSMYQ